MAGNINIERPSEGYVKVPNELMNNPAIDMETLGVYVRILSLGKNWRFSMKGFSAAFDIKPARLQKSIKTLEQAGYMRRRRVTDEKNKFVGWEYSVASSAIFVNDCNSSSNDTSRLPENPTIGNPDYRKNRQSEIPTIGNPDYRENGPYTIDIKNTIDLSGTIERSGQKTGSELTNQPAGQPAYISDYASYAANYMQRVWEGHADTEAMMRQTHIASREEFCQLFERYCDELTAMRAKKTERYLLMDFPEWAKKHRADLLPAGTELSRPPINNLNFN